MNHEELFVYVLWKSVDEGDDEDPPCGRTSRWEGRATTQGQQEHVEDEGGRDGGDDQAGGGRGHLLGDGRDRSGYLTG